MYKTMWICLLALQSTFLVGVLVSTTMIALGSSQEFWLGTLTACAASLAILTVLEVDSLLSQFRTRKRSSTKGLSLKKTTLAREESADYEI